MRRTALFIGSILAAIGLILVVEWRIDAYGDIYRGGALHAAQRGGCVISDDLVGPAGLYPLKDAIVRDGQPREVVIGTSRALKVRPRPGETTFANYAIPGTRSDMTPLFRRLHKDDPHLRTVIVSAEYFWFNANWAWSGYAPVSASATAIARRLLTRQRLDATLARLRDDPLDLVHPWRRTEVGSTCAIDRAGRLGRGEVNAWRTDGSLEYAFELVPRLHQAWEKARRAGFPGGDYSRDLGPGKARFGGGYYNSYERLSPRALAGLRRSLALAKSYGWRVIGYSPPYSATYFERLATAPETARTWRAFAPAMQAAFARYGYRFVDLRDVRKLPCRAPAFIDDGWHPSEQCAAVVRARAEAAAR